MKVLLKLYILLFKITITLLHLINMFTSSSYKESNLKLFTVSLHSNSSLFSHITSGAIPSLVLSVSIVQAIRRSTCVLICLQHVHTHIPKLRNPKLDTSYPTSSFVFYKHEFSSCLYLYVRERLAKL